MAAIYLIRYGCNIHWYIYFSEYTRNYKAIWRILVQLFVMYVVFVLLTTVLRILLEHWLFHFLSAPINNAIIDVHHLCLILSQGICYLIIWPLGFRVGVQYCNCNPPPPLCLLATAKWLLTVWWSDQKICSGMPKSKLSWLPWLDFLHCFVFMAVHGLMTWPQLLCWDP